MSEHQIPTDPARSTAEVATPQATRYLAQLCKHFQHRRPVSLADADGHIEFATGNCALHAETGVLRLSLDAPDNDQLHQLQDVVARHLLRFAFREDMQIVWQCA
ncbi:MAG TPA: DUF2218 domain-containing protein [Acetobacteraceae bacterium]|jgi:hypothetical protein